MEPLLVRFPKDQRAFIRRVSKKYKMKEAEFVRYAIKLAVKVEKEGADALIKSYFS